MNGQEFPGQHAALVPDRPVGTPERRDSAGGAAGSRQILHEQTLRRAGGEALLLGLVWQLLGLILRGAGVTQGIGRSRGGPRLTATRPATATKTRWRRVRASDYGRF